MWLVASRGILVNVVLALERRISYYLELKLGSSSIADNTSATYAILLLFSFRIMTLPMSFNLEICSNMYTILAD